MEFSEDIKQLLKDKFPDKDMYSMSKDELIQFREEVVELREEYNLLEQAMKSLGNAAYGAAANQYFYFFNVELAGDITGECRNLTKSMIRNLENLFHEEIWTRKDLQEKFDFELDESMHEWYREQPIWVYSDTDSVAADSKIIVKITNKNCSKQEIKEITFNDLYNIVKNKCYINKNSNGKEIIYINDISVLNVVDNKPVFVPIKYLIRHKVSKAKYKIKTKSGKEIIVTNDHSCIVIRNGKQISIKAKDINIKTDKIISVYVKSEFTIEVEDIESIECIGQFEDEYVYDIEVDDDSHTFVANNVLVHNSAYTTYGSLFRCMTPKYKEKYSTDKAKLDFILRFNKEFLDDQNNKWCHEIYDKRFGNSVHEFELETVSRSGIFLKKKMNMKALAYSKGKYFDDYKISGTGIELIKTTTPSLCRKIIKDITMSLMYDYDEDKKVEYIQALNAKLKQYKKEFWCANPEEISQSIGVGSYKTYVLNDEDELQFALKAPVSVKSVGWFNYLAHKNGDDNKKFYSGKIKYYRFLNGKNKEYFGYPAGELPSWAPPMDKNEQWQKTVISPINRFLEVMKIPIKPGEDNIQLGLFDFA